MTTKARIRQYKALTKEIAAELKQPPGSEAVRHLVAFRMMRDAIQARLLTGHLTNTDADALIKCNEVLKEFLPKGAPLSVDLNIMKPSDVTCPCCQHRFNARDNKTVVPEPPPPNGSRISPKPDNAASEARNGPSEPATGAHAPPDNVVAFPAAQQPASIHDRVVLPNGRLEKPPLRSAQPSMPDAPYGGAGSLCW